MSQPNPTKSTITRRSLLAGTAAGVTVTALTFPLTSSAFSAQSANVSTLQPTHQNSLCAAHHQELAAHLKSVLNASYVDEQMKNTVLRTTTCPHCNVAIAPDQMPKTSLALA